MRRSERLELEERMPCVADERHVFASGDEACLCTALRRATVIDVPEIVAYWPNEADR